MNSNIIVIIVNTIHTARFKNKYISSLILFKTSKSQYNHHTFIIPILYLIIILPVILYNYIWIHNQLDKFDSFLAQVLTKMIVKLNLNLGTCVLEHTQLLLSWGPSWRHDCVILSFQFDGMKCYHWELSWNWAQIQQLIVINYHQIHILNLTYLLQPRHPRCMVKQCYKFTFSYCKPTVAILELFSNVQDQI